MKTITHKQLEEGLAAVKGGTIIVLAYRSIPKMYKAGNPYAGKIQKKIVLKGQVGINYENAVNNKLDEPTFKAQAHSWADEGDKHFVYLRGRPYLRLREFSRTETFITDNEEVIDRAAVAPFLYPEKEEIVKIRTLDLSKIESLKVGGEQYFIHKIGVDT